MALTGSIAVGRAAFNVSKTEPTWRVMQARFSDATLLELLALAGWYHAICYIANGAQVELEPWAPPFPQVR